MNSLLSQLRDRIWRLLPASREFDPHKLLPPPWVAKPEWPADSMGWRMGGEQYFYAVRDMYAALSPPEQAAYERAFPAPAGWEQYLQRQRRG